MTMTRTLTVALGVLALSWCASGQTYSPEQAEEDYRTSRGALTSQQLDGLAEFMGAQCVQGAWWQYATGDEATGAQRAGLCITGCLVFELRRTQTCVKGAWKFVDSKDPTFALAVRGAVAEQTFP